MKFKGLSKHSLLTSHEKKAGTAQSVYRIQWPRNWF